MNITLYSLDMSITNVGQGRIIPLGSYSSPLDSERGGVEQQAHCSLLPPCEGNSLILLNLHLSLLLYLCLVQFFETQRAWTQVLGRLKRLPFSNVISTWNLTFSISHSSHCHNLVLHLRQSWSSRDLCVPSSTTGSHALGP